MTQTIDGSRVTLTVREVARVVKKQEAWVRARIADGQLRASRLGWDWRIRPEDLEAFLDAAVDTQRKPRLRRAGSAR